MTTLVNFGDYLRARLARDEEGVTAMEYGLIAALIAIVIILALTFAGEALNNIFLEIACTLSNDETSEACVALSA